MIRIDTITVSIKQAVQDKYQAAAGSFPNADYPLSYVQIDHTKLDIEIVDDEFRQAIDRAYITLAIDVFSRMIVGYYISLEAPSATSVAMCTASAILSKKRKLIELNIDAEWDVEGVYKIGGYSQFAFLAYCAILIQLVLSVKMLSFNFVVLFQHFDLG